MSQTALVLKTRKVSIEVNFFNNEFDRRNLIEE